MRAYLDFIVTGTMFRYIHANQRYAIFFLFPIFSVVLFAVAGWIVARLAIGFLGLDGVGNEEHECQAIALEDSEVCVLPFDRVEQIARESAAFQHNVHRYLSREIARQRTLMLLLGTMRADQRLAAFLLDLSQRYQARGYSSSEFILRMTREEIGSYLGLKLETISRLLSRLQQEGLIQVQGRVVKLLERPALRQLVGQSD